MKRIAGTRRINLLAVAMASTMFTISASADGVYQGFAEGNTDLYPHNVRNADAVVGVQPGVGDRLDIYGGFERGNGDLFSGSAGTGWSASKGPGIYGGFGERNPDLQ